jgi:hypothetical protein
VEGSVAVGEGTGCGRLRCGDVLWQALGALIIRNRGETL